MTVEKHEYDNRYEVTLNDEPVLTREGARQWPPDESGINELLNAAEQRLDDANIGNPQREAHLDVLNLMRAAFGNVPTVDHRDGEP